MCPHSCFCVFGLNGTGFCTKRLTSEPITITASIVCRLKVSTKKRQRFKCTLRPKEEWIPISVPPIIDLATFHAAAGRARENEAFSPRNLQRGGYLLRKLVRCGRCGSSCSALTSKQTYGGKVHGSH